MKQAILTVIGKDRPGIIAAVTAILFQNRCNLEDVSMTVLEGEFAMILIVQLPAQAKAAGIQQEFRKILEKRWGLTWFWKTLPHALKRGHKHGRNTTPFLLTMVGNDKMGIVHQTSETLAQLGLNITDLQCQILGRGARCFYSMFLEFDAPRGISMGRLQRSLEALARKTGNEFRLKPVERLEF